MTSALHPTPSSRAEKTQMAQALREEGLLTREVAERMGVAVSTADGWLNDPTGARLRARKDSYRGQCLDCGAPTDGSNGIAAGPTRCAACAQAHAHETRKWTPETVRQAVLSWAADHGYAPTVQDANTDPCLPSFSVLAIVELGGWRKLLVDLGLKDPADRRGAGRGPGSVTKDDALDAIFAYREHGSLAKAAGALRISSTSVRNRMITLKEGRDLLMPVSHVNGQATESRAVIVLRRELERSEKLAEQKRVETLQIEAEAKTLKTALAQLTGEAD